MVWGLGLRGFRACIWYFEFESEWFRVAKSLQRARGPNPSTEACQ